MTTKIASIYFAPVKAQRMFGGPYELPAVPVGAQPAILSVSDRIQYEDGPYNLSNNGKRSKRRYLVFGQDIANDLVNEWTAHGVGMTPQCRPGIWVVRERLPLLNEDGSPQFDADGVPTWRDATDEEREAMWAEDLAAARLADRAYANMLFVQANAMAEDPRLIPFIANNARVAARQYGLTAEWLKEDAALAVKTCQYCTKVIPARAIKCPKCTEIVDVEGYARLEAEKALALKIAKQEAARAVAENTVSLPS